MQLRYLSALPVVFSALLMATNVNAQQNDPLDGWPQWVEESMAKESRKSKVRKIKTPDDAISTKLPGKLSAPQAIEGGWYFQTDIKAGSPLECYIFTVGQNLATLTSLIANSNVDVVGTNNKGTVENRRIFHTDAGSLGGMPYLALEWIYTIESDAQTLVGFTKVRAAAKGDIAFACAHNYLGYRETFANAFSEFVENAKYVDTTPQPYYEEIATLDFNGIGSGIAYAAFTADEVGDIEMYAFDASIAPVDAGTVISSDSVTVTFTTPEGELINTVNVNVENGEIVSNLSLQANDEGNWVSSGILQGKPIEAILDGTVSPATPLGQMALTRELFAGTETSVSMDVWVPNADPTRFLEAKITRDDAEIKGRANLNLGPINYSGQFDDYGNLVDAKMYIGPLTINIERAWSSGSLAK